MQTFTCALVLSFHMCVCVCVCVCVFVGGGGGSCLVLVCYVVVFFSELMDTTLR